MTSRFGPSRVTRWLRSALGRFAAVLFGVANLALLTSIAPPAEGATIPVSIVTSALAQGEVGASYFVELSASGGTPPYSWSISTGQLTGGLTLNSSGTLSGRPGTAGTTQVNLHVLDANGLGTVRTLPLTVKPAPLETQSLEAVTREGQLFSLQNISGQTPTVTEPTPSLGGHTVALIAPSDQSGYWIVSSRGQVTGSQIRSLGSLSRRSKKRIVSAAAQGNSGYWLLGSNGHVYRFGTARNYGSVHATKRTGPVVAIMSSPDGGGYWIVFARGRVECFGSAFRLGSVSLDGSSSSMVAGAVSGTNGYWLLATDGRVYRFGSALPLGSLRAPLALRAVSIFAMNSGLGYWIATSTGQIFGIGQARNMAGLPAGYSLIAIAN